MRFQAQQQVLGVDDCKALTAYDLVLFSVWLSNKVKNSSTGKSYVKWDDGV